MQFLRLYSAVALGVAGTSGCADVVGIPSESSIPVIEGLLVPGDTAQVLAVHWSFPADRPHGGTPIPVPQSDVSLRLILPDGTELPFLAVAQAPGHFAVGAPIQPSGFYRLSGFVAGHAISAATTVPGDLSVNIPATDTIRFSGGPPGLSGSGVPLPYHWSAERAAVYMVFHAQAQDNGLSAGAVALADTSGTLRLLSVTDTSRLTVLAYDSNAAAFLTAAVPKGSIQGAFGMFGAATRAERTIIWR